MPLTAEVRPCFAVVGIPLECSWFLVLCSGSLFWWACWRAVDYVLLLFTYAYGFSAIVRARNRRLLTSGTTAALIVLHALFVADVIAAIVLYMKIRKATKGTSDGMMEAETA